MLIRGHDWPSGRDGGGDASVTAHGQPFQPGGAGGNTIEFNGLSDMSCDLWDQQEAFREKHLCRHFRRARDRDHVR